MGSRDDGNIDSTWQQPPAEGSYPSMPEQQYPSSYGAQPYETPQQYGTPTYGTQPYGQAYGSVPPPGYPMPPAAPYGGYPQPPAVAGTNGLAIASLIASCLGFLYGLTAIVGIILGIIALNQIKQTRQQGRGLAIAGIAVGGVFVALFLLAVLVLVIVGASGY